MQKLLTRELETILQTAEKPVVLDFYADWCVPCRMQAPQFQQAEAALAGKAEFYKVDIEEHPELSARFGVMSIPTIALLQGGELLWRNVGVTRQEEIVAAVQKHCKL